MDDIRPLRAIAKNKQVIESKLQLFAPPIAYQASYQQPTGSRFGGDALYNGENRSDGAHLSYFITVDEKDVKEEEEDDDGDDTTEEESAETKDENTVKWDSLTLNIYDGERLIRTLKQKAAKESGIHKWTWSMDEKGAETPSRTISKSTREPGGVSVKPGNYKVVISFGDQSSEAMITVKSDPRINRTPGSLNEVYEASQNIQDMYQTAADAVKQLVECKTIAKRFNKELSSLDKEEYKDQIKSSRDIAKKIEDLIAIYIGKEDKRQGITRNPEVNVNQRIGTAYSYIASRQSGLTATENRLIDQAKASLNEAIKETNSFFSDEWQSYQEAMEALETSPFKEVKTFSLD